MTHAGTYPLPVPKADQQRKQTRSPLRQRQRLGLGQANEIVSARSSPMGYRLAAQHLPSNTRTGDWYEGRVTDGPAYLGAPRRRRHDVAMNPTGPWGPRTLESIEPGGYCSTISTKPMPSSKFAPP